MHQTPTLAFQAEPVIKRVRALIKEDRLEEVSAELRLFNMALPGAARAVERVIPGMLLSNYPPLLRQSSKVQRYCSENPEWADRLRRGLTYGRFPGVVRGIVAEVEEAD